MPIRVEHFPTARYLDTTMIRIIGALLDQISIIQMSRNPPFNNREMDIVMTNVILEPLTKNTVTYKEQLLAQLKQVKRQGYVMTYGEVNSGAMCISVPIKNYILPAAISILGPESRMKKRQTDYINELVASGSRVHNNITQIFSKDS